MLKNTKTYHHQVHVADQMILQNQLISDASTFTGEGLEAIKNVKGTNLIVDDIVDKIYLNAGVSKAAGQPVVRANAREFLNRVKDLD